MQVISSMGALIFQNADISKNNDGNCKRSILCKNISLVRRRLGTIERQVFTCVGPTIMKK